MANKHKAYVSNFTMRFGSATVSGALYPVKSNAKKVNYKLFTPDGVPTQQVYMDDNGKTWYKSSLVRGRKNEDGEIELVSQEVVEDAKESRLPLNILNLTAHPEADVNAAIFPAENQAYVFMPVIKDKKGKVVQDVVNEQWYDFLNNIVRESHITFLGMCNLQHFEGLFRVGLYQGWLTIQKQLYPEQLHQFDPYTPAMDDNEKRKALQVTNKAIKRFSHEEYVDQINERMAALSVATTPDLTGPIPAKSEKIDMMAALDMFEAV